MTILEHSLIILLLLVALLNSAVLQGLMWWLIGGGLALAFLSPTPPISLPWDWLAALAIPLILWQTAHRLVSARWAEKGRDFALWLGLAAAISAFLWLSEDLAPAGAILFGLLSASMMWRATEEQSQPSYLGQVGPLALAFLLAEIAPAVEAPGRYFFALSGGSAIGAFIGYLAGRIIPKFAHDLHQEILSLGQVYLAYAVASLLGMSGVAAALLSVTVFVAYSVTQGLWTDGRIRPRPLDRKPVFLSAVVVLAFFSWQMHVPITPRLMVEIAIAMILTALAVWVGILMKSPTFLAERSFIRVLRRVGFLFIPAIFLWPRETLLDPVPLMIALAAAGLAVLGTHYVLSPLVRFYTWLDQMIEDLEQLGEPVPIFLVRDFMSRDYVTIQPELSIIEVVRLMDKTQDRCLPVVEDDRLVGIVTEADLFVKEERIPRTDRTYEVLFKEPVLPEFVHEVYRRGAQYRASDVMTGEVAWLKEKDSIGDAVRLMVRNGYSCLPVLSADPEAGGELVGMMTRFQLVRRLLQIDQEEPKEPAI